MIQDDTTRIRLNKSVSKTSANRPPGAHIDLKARQSLIPLDSMYGRLSLEDLYNNERAECTTIRLICEINPVISNSLFNRITEVVKDEGSPAVSCLNFEAKTDDSTIGKEPTFQWTPFECTRDTQLSRTYSFHCGKDIFNNHLFRSSASKVIFSPPETAPTRYFNTLFDNQRDRYGNQIYANNTVATYFKTRAGQQVHTIPIRHEYTILDTLTFDDSVAENLAENNGWLGFYNPSKLRIFGETGNIWYYRAINTEEANKFINMYPGREEFTFIPRYNKFRDRLEKNWNYCITYPSSSTTEGFVFLNSDIDSMRILSTEASEVKSNGVTEIVFHTYIRHGLIDNDVVNIYNGTEPVIMGTEVSFEDEYTFTVENASNLDAVDLTTAELSFKKVIGGIECEYYVRIFSRLPNFKYSNAEINEYTLYSEGSTLIADHQGVDNEFGSHVSSMGFAKNAYGDDIAEIVFTDDIDIAYLKDNLGRPLTEIYLTIIKNNRGYKNWYSGRIGEEDVEYSHCFGKLNCGFVMSPDVSGDTVSSIRHMHNINRGEDVSVSGLSTSYINNGEDDFDDIDYYTQNNFYGDLCCFSPADAYEEVIEDVMFRFNTAQRELNLNTDAWCMKYDEIIRDDNGMSKDIEGASVFSNGTMSGATVSDGTATMMKEGYYYRPHNLIDMRIQSPEATEVKGDLYVCLDIDKYSYDVDGVTYSGFSIIVTEDIRLNLNEELFLVSMETFESWKCNVVDIISDRKFEVTCNELKEEDYSGLYKLILVKRPGDVPSYARFVNDGSCRFVWRDVIQNGMEIASGAEEYPFANGRIYITKKFGLYLRRQDPHDETIGKRNKDKPSGDVDGKKHWEKRKKKDYTIKEDEEC